MYSMIATAPESIQQRRRLQTGASPKQSPSKKATSRNSPLSYPNVLSSSCFDTESHTPNNSTIPAGGNPATAEDENVEKCVSNDETVSRDLIKTLAGEPGKDGNDDQQSDSPSRYPPNAGEVSSTNNYPSDPAEMLGSLSLLDAEVDSSDFADFEMEREVPDSSSPFTFERECSKEQILRNDGGGKNSNIPGIVANNLVSKSNHIQYTRSWSIEPKVKDAQSDFDHSGKVESFHNQQCDESERNEPGMVQSEIISRNASNEKGIFQSPVNNPTETHDPLIPSSEQVSEFNISEVPSYPVDEMGKRVDDCAGDSVHKQPLVLRARSAGVSLFVNSNSSDAASSFIGGDDDDDDDHEEEEDVIYMPPDVSRSSDPNHSPLFFTSSNTVIGNQNDEREIQDDCKEITNYSANRSFGQTNQPQSDYVANSRNQYVHAHSLLDDCSDEEDDITSVASTSYGRSFSCFPKRQIGSGNESYYSYFKKQRQKKETVDANNSAQPSANEVASKNIQLCMLKTRHRRWTCQSALAGPHAQSDQVLDLSQRVVHYPMRLANHRYNNVQPALKAEDDITFLARLSVPGAAIRAASIASGIWRTVRLVRLPRGLFGWHWLLWREINGLQGWEFRSKGLHENDGGIEDNDVWSLLRMLGELFPMMDQIDFGGDVAHSNESFTVQEGKTGFGAISSKDAWKKEIRLRVLKCLPNLIAIDGFDVVREDLDAESCNEVTIHATEEVTDPNNSLDKQNSFEDVDLDQSVDDLSNNMHLSEKRNTAMAQNSRACVDCDSVEVSMMCGWSDLVGNTFNENMGAQMETTAEVSDQNGIEATSTGIDPDQCEIAADMLTSDAIEDVSENVMSMVDNSVAYSNSDDRDQNSPIVPDKQDPLPEPYPGDIDLPTSPSSSLLSSRSWSSNGSGTRPPTCPSSSSRNRTPTKLVENRNSKSTLTKAKYWKRRVLGLIPSVSVMDEDDDDEENEADNVDDCPHDIL